MCGSTRSSCTRWSGPARRYQHASEVRDDVQRVASTAGAPEVKAPIPSHPEAGKPRPRNLLGAGLAVLFLAGFFFAFAFHAERTGHPPPTHIVIGAVDPIFTWVRTPTSFHTNFNAFSWSFFAAVVAGAAFGALWRIHREETGKVPRDPAWWRDWWKQLSLWGGLLLVVCIVRTVRDSASIAGWHQAAAQPPPVRAEQPVTYPDGHSSIVNAPALQAAEPLKQPFMIGSAGPELTNEAVQKLKLSKLQSEEIGRILLAYHREFLALQRRHSKVGKDDAGRLLVTIEPFYDECLELAQRLQTELGGIVDATLLPVIKNGELATQIFSWGGACNETITMWKADGKYYVEEKLTSAPGHDRDPYTLQHVRPETRRNPRGIPHLLAGVRVHSGLPSEPRSDEQPGPRSRASLRGEPQGLSPRRGGLVVAGCLALLIALGLIGLGLWCCNTPGGGGEWQGLNKLVGYILLGSGAAVLIPAIFMLVAQKFVRAGSRTAAAFCIITEIVFALIPAALIAGLAVFNRPSTEEIAFGFVGLGLWIAPHWWLLATLRKARARDSWSRRGSGRG